MSTSTNGAYTETWLAKLQGPKPIATSGYSLSDGRHYLFVAASDGSVRPLTIGPPNWQWAWRAPITQHAGIVGIAAYFHPGDGRHHCFVALQSGDILEMAFASIDDPSTLVETWLGNLNEDPRGLAGFSSVDGSQHLFVVGAKGLVHPLEITPSSNWQWSWAASIMSSHDEIVGITAYFHSYDHAQHVIIVLKSGDVWEAFAVQEAGWIENWLGVLDGGASALAGHSAPNGTQHLFAAGAPGWVLPLQIGPPHWKWRWDNRVMSHHDGVVGLASYFNGSDGQQRVVAVLQSGDIWESRFQLRSQVATHEWNPSEFPISYWAGPLGIESSVEKYKQVADAGFTFAVRAWEEGVPGLQGPNSELLAACGAAGLRMFVFDQSVYAVASGTSSLDEQAKQDLDAAIAVYSGHSALAGYFLADEVAPPSFAHISEIVDYFRKNDPGRTCFAELYPVYGDRQYSPPSAPLSYDDYVEGFINDIKLPYLCFDNYALLAWYANLFYTNLRVIRVKSFMHQKPFWQFVSSSQFGLRPDGTYENRLPTEAELRCQAMQVLAFGGKGILWFTYWQTSGGSTAIINRDGTPSSKYAEVQQVNADVRAIGWYLLTAHNIAVYESGNLSAGGTPPPTSGLVRLLSGTDITIGIFSTEAVPNSSSATRFLVMLASRNANATVSAKVSFSATMLQKLDKATGAWNSVGADSGIGPPIETELMLAPGDAELFLAFAPTSPVWRKDFKRHRVRSTRKKPRRWWQFWR